MKLAERMQVLARLDFENPAQHMPTEALAEWARVGPDFKGVKFRVLQIEPMNEYLRRRQSPKKAPLNATALHIRRGHFKDYRQGAGLFGKVKGLFWWDMSAAGGMHAGVVIKEYAVNGPTQ